MRYRSHPRQWAAVLMVGLALLGSQPLGAAALAAPRFAPQSNPFAYAAEYRDRVSGALYLRARWYQPGVPSFVSRDPQPGLLGHYGYGGGNPVLNVDPNGANYRSFGRGVDRLNAGVGGHFARLFLGQFLVPLDAIAHAPSFWRALRHDTGGVTAFLTAGALVEFASYASMSVGAARVLSVSTGRRLFALRTGAESVLGIGQSAVGSFSHHFEHFHGASLWQGLESIIGPEAVYRVAIGIGYEPFNLTHADVDTLLRARLSGDNAIIFRVRSELLEGPGGRVTIGKGWTTPLADLQRGGWYHERLVAITRDSILISETLPVRMIERPLQGLGGPYDIGAGQHWWEFIGATSAGRAREVFVDANPRKMYRADEVQNFRPAETFEERRPFDQSANNAHHHVAEVRRMLGL